MISNDIRKLARKHQRDLFGVVIIQSLDGKEPSKQHTIMRTTPNHQNHTHSIVTLTENKIASLLRLNL